MKTAINCVVELVRDKDGNILMIESLIVYRDYQIIKALDDRESCDTIPFIKVMPINTEEKNENDNPEIAQIFSINHLCPSKVISYHTCRSILLLINEVLLLLQVCSS